MCRFAKFRADGEISQCAFNNGNTFLVMAVKNVKGLFQACLNQREYITDQIEENKTLEDVFMSEITKEPDLFGEPAAFEAQN